MKPSCSGRECEGRGVGCARNTCTYTHTLVYPWLVAHKSQAVEARKAIASSLRLLGYHRRRTRVIHSYKLTTRRETTRKQAAGEEQGSSAYLQNVSRHRPKANSHQRRSAASELSQIGRRGVCPSCSPNDGVPFSPSTYPLPAWSSPAARWLDPA